MILSVKFLRCLRCQNVYNNTTTSPRTNDYRGLSEVKCSRCSTKWLVCPLHEHRWSLQRYKYAHVHVQTMHKNMSIDSLTSNTSEPTSTNSINNDFMSIENDIDIENNLTNPVTTIENGNDMILNEFLQGHKDVDLSTYNVNVKRFIKCESEQSGNGIKQIVHNAFAMNTDNNHTDTPWNEIKYHMKATMFCCALSTAQQANFGDLCNMMENTFYNDNSFNNRNHISRVPVSSKDIDRFYLKRSTSIARNIPIPSIIEFDDHACVSITEVIHHVLYFAIPIDGMLTKSVSQEYKNIITSSSPMTCSSMSNSIRSQVRIACEPNKISPLIIPIILWSDDFEPNHVKQHKKSTWIKTVTVAPPHDCQTSSKHTFVIALGPKDKDHEQINVHFFEELKRLETPTYMYCRATNTNIPVVVKILAISADRPERCALNCMLGHGGLTTRRWRYSAYIDQPKLKSCSSCLKHRLLNLKIVSSNTSTYCRDCYDWNYDHPSMHKAKPLEYPKSQHADSPPPPIGREVMNVNILRPIELSYNTMIQGVRFCFHNCYHAEWTKLSAMSYLKSIGVNEAYGSKYVYQKALDCKKNPMVSSSNLFDYLTFPVHWTCGISLDQCIDTPMHQIFQGVVKSIMEKTMSWLIKKDTSHYKAFGDVVNDTLFDIHKLGLDWCRMEKLMRGRSYTMGGWQAEQYIAFTRCSIVIYSAIREVVSDDEVGIDEHECMIQAMLSFISRLMCNDAIDMETLMEHIKIFLSACDAFESRAYLMNGDDFMWFSKGNFLSLLNLPSQISKFGRVRLYWEGSRERSIQQIKPFLINIRQTSSYFKTKLTRMYVSETLDSINTALKGYDAEDNQCSPRNEYNRYSSFKTYSTYDNIEDFISTGKVISVVYLSLRNKAPRFYICQHNDIPKKYSLFQVSFQDDVGFNKCGLWYAPIETAIANVNAEMTQEEINCIAEDYAILCPCLTRNEQLQLSYTVICKSWKYRNKYNVLSLPDVSVNFFRRTFHL